MDRTYLKREHQDEGTEEGRKKQVLGFQCDVEAISFAAFNLNCIKRETYLAWQFGDTILG